jgi:capsular polysaccharide biosynthesis protein
MDSTAYPPQDDEIDLLDLLVTIAESWKLLVFGPLLAGAAAFGVATLVMPVEYQSTAILRLVEDEAAVLHSAAVLDPLLEPFGYLSEENGFLEDARAALKQDLIQSADKRTKLVTISAKAASPEQAQQLNNQAIQLLLAELTPKGQVKVNVLQSIQLRQEAVAVAEQSFAKMIESVGPNEVSANATGLVSNLTELVTLVQTNKQEIQTLQSSLQPKGAEVFVQPATLPQKPLPQKLALVAVVAVLASGFALLLFVFVRKAWANAGSNPESAAKLAAIRRSLGLQ